MRAAAPLLICCALVAACGTPSQPAGAAIAAGAAQNGQTISLHPGDTLRLTLDSTAWTIGGSSDPSVLQPQGAQVVSPAPPGACPPGMGCGTTGIVFKALKQGTATVAASRISCGEAMRCVGSQGTYELQVTVG